VIGQNATRRIPRGASREIERQIRVVRHQLIVRAGRDGSITLSESVPPTARGTGGRRMLVRVLEGNGDVHGQVARHDAALSQDLDVRGLAVGSGVSSTGAS
jgi:hypothetical protein